MSRLLTNSDMTRSGVSARAESQLKPNRAMLSTEVTWQELKSEFTYLESDSIATIRTGENSLAFLPVFHGLGLLQISSVLS